MAGEERIVAVGRTPMIDLYFWPTPNCWKVSIALEELGLPYRLMPVNIRTGEHREPAYHRINPSDRVPALVDHAPVDGGEHITLFESGAILQYLADKTGALIPPDTRGRYEALVWLTFQLAGVGPVAGQVKHFRDVDKGANEPALARFTAEMRHAYKVLDERLASRRYLAGSYSIADVAVWPFVLPYERDGRPLDDFPHLARWADELLARPAVRRGLDAGAELRPGGPLDARVTALLAARRGPTGAD